MLVHHPKNRIISLSGDKFPELAQYDIRVISRELIRTSERRQHLADGEESIGECRRIPVKVLSGDPPECPYDRILWYRIPGLTVHEYVYSVSSRQRLEERVIPDRNPILPRWPRSEREYHQDGFCVIVHWRVAHGVLRGKSAQMATGT